MHSPITTYAGIDWATRSHVVCVIDETGSAIERFEVEHDAAGMRSLAKRLTARHVSGVAIERPDGPVVDALLGAGLRVVVIASRHIKALRSRYGSAGNKDDRADAYILADVLRTDGQRLRPLLPDSPATVALRASVRARKGPGAHPGAPGAAARCAPRARVPRRPGALRQARLTHRGGLPDPLPQRDRGNLAEPAAFRCLAHQSGLLGSSHRRRAPCPTHRSTGG